LKGFTVAGPDRKFLWGAETKIEGEELLVWSDGVQNPVAVRYAWGANPVCSLYNRAGLPASTFRTDDWPGVTYDKR
jgi:sialate O-acetylesterase